MGGMSVLVGAVAVGAGAVGYLGRNVLPQPVVYGLGHAAVSGLVISLAASDFLCNRSTFILGKVRTHLVESHPACSLKALC